MTTAAQIIALADKLGIKASLWHKGGMTRIYAETGREDMRVFLRCDGTPDDIEGARFQVFCNAEQHPNWLKKQEAEFREAYIGLMYAYVYLFYLDVGDEPNGYGPDINEMIWKARDFVHQRITPVLEDRP
jgi:hypothetical protein